MIRRRSERESVGKRLVGGFVYVSADSHPPYPSQAERPDRQDQATTQALGNVIAAWGG